MSLVFAFVAGGVVLFAVLGLIYGNEYRKGK